MTAILVRALHPVLLRIKSASYYTMFELQWCNANRIATNTNRSQSLKGHAMSCLVSPQQRPSQSEASAWPLRFVYLRNKVSRNTTFQIPVPDIDDTTRVGRSGTYGNSPSRPISQCVVSLSPPFFVAPSPFLYSSLHKSISVYPHANTPSARRAHKTYR